MAGTAKPACVCIHINVILAGAIMNGRQRTLLLCTIPRFGVQFIALAKGVKNKLVVAGFWQIHQFCSWVFEFVI